MSAAPDHRAAQALTTLQAEIQRLTEERNVAVNVAVSKVPGFDVEALRLAAARAQTAEAKVARAEALHRPRPEQFLTGDCASEDCDHEDECHTSPLDVCAHCYDLAADGNPYAFEDRTPAQLLWPCPTATALDGAS